MMDTPSFMARPVTIGICTSLLRSNIENFIAKVSSLTNVTVQFIELPYSNLDSHLLPSAGLDGVIICHSINNRGFAITDVMNALYDKFLPDIRRNFGRDSVCVIAHDFLWPMVQVSSISTDHARVKDTHLNSFRSNQPTTFECCQLAMICGRLDKQVDMDEEDWKRLENFLLQCRVNDDVLITTEKTPHIPQSVRNITPAVEEDIPFPAAQRPPAAQGIFTYALVIAACIPYIGLFLMILKKYL